MSSDCTFNFYFTISNREIFNNGNVIPLSWYINTSNCTSILINHHLNTFNTFHCDITISNEKYFKSQPIYIRVPYLVNISGPILLQTLFRLELSFLIFFSFSFYLIWILSHRPHVEVILNQDFSHC